MCHATSAGRKAGSVSTNKSQFVDTLSTNKAYILTLVTQQSVPESDMFVNAVLLAGH